MRRRYSEFASLRSTLVNLHPTLIIPPIPEKHTMADYAAKPTKAKEDAGIIELRKRMLAVFLNRCRRMKEVREDGVWWRFLDPNASWVSYFLFTFKTEGKLNRVSSERSASLSSGSFDTKERPESPTARYSKSNGCSQLPSNPIILGEIKDSKCYDYHDWNTYCF